MPDQRILGIPADIIRAGKTGEYGHISKCKASDGAELCEKLLQAGQGLYLAPCEAAALDLCKFENRFTKVLKEGAANSCLVCFVVEALAQASRALMNLLYYADRNLPFWEYAETDIDKLGELPHNALAEAKVPHTGLPEVGRNTYRSSQAGTAATRDFCLSCVS